MVKLFCAKIGGAGGVFSVDINEDLSVDDLKKAIKREKLYSITCAADQLQLFLAKRGIKWIKQNSTLNAVLLSANATSYVEMQASERIADLFGRSPRSKAIHVLMVVPQERQPAFPATYHESFVEIQEAFKRQRRAIDSYYYQQQTRATAELPHKAPKSYTTAWIGLQERLRLEKDDLMIEIAPVENGETFWSVEVQAQVDAMTKEADLDTFIAPYLNDVLARYDLVLIKSAEPWLAQDVVPKSTTVLKPDAFATHTGMYRSKSVANNWNGFRCGVAVEELYDCVFLFERQLTITDEAFGQMIQYLENLTHTAYGILFDCRSFWLIESYNSAVVKVEKSTWVSKGSKDALQNFIMKKLSPCPVFLARACSSLSVDVVEGDAFLGRGAFGYVFKVTLRGRQQVMALKVSCDEEYAARLYGEEEVLSYGQHTGLTVRPVEEVLCIEVDGPDDVNYTGLGGALLLSPVGTPLPRPTTHKAVQQLFELLWLLHNKGVPHGDPRVQNVIVSEGKLLWIDPFRHVLELLEATTKSKARDATILTRSVLHLDHGVALGSVLEQLITNYGNNSTLENIDLLAKVVHQLMSP
ncbi:hypothetical protein P3T76_015217 [Phytophthora citrophthora]|uniref:Protein kinase domain-containing protein n=1 Tax=Phytophthora citrophthora TaxID=4793 RepID=A0AAD9FZV6_9STRA|nr:hypothetical protein P3T76_015217 [Phytophthora citrophthora]